MSDEGQLLAYADLNSRAYGFPLEAGRDGLAGSSLWRGGCTPTSGFGRASR